MKTEKLITVLIIPLWICMLLAQPLYAKVYKWTDEDGRTYFTDDSSKIPEKYRKNIKEKKLTYRRRIVSCDMPIPQTMKDNLLELDNKILRDEKKLNRMLGNIFKGNSANVNSNSLKVAKLIGNLKRNRRLHEKITWKYKCVLGG